MQEDPVIYRRARMYKRPGYIQEGHTVTLKDLSLQRRAPILQSRAPHHKGDSSFTSFTAL